MGYVPRNPGIVRPVRESATQDIEFTRLLMWSCSDCAWYRVRTNTTEWERTKIPHPVYGEITNYDAYLKDIYHHDCLETRNARIRLGINPDRPRPGHGPYQQDRGRNYAS